MTRLLTAIMGLGLALLAAVSLHAQALPDHETTADLTCPDAGLLGPGLFTNICWDCIFPIRIAGVDADFGALFGNVGGGGSYRTDAPSNAVDSPFCLCEDAFGLPHPGFSMGMWEPARLVEIVRTPGCSPVLSGTRITAVDRIRQGSGGGWDHDMGDPSFYHYHLWAFPVLAMLDLFMDADCLDDAMGDIDVLYFSELDPTWNHDELAFFLNPESAALANPIAQAACLADAVSANVGEPIDTLFWCAGSQFLYPLAGHHLVHTSNPRTTNLLAVRAMAALHRRGLARRTMGNDAICDAVIEPFLPKSQYQLSVAYPVPEANGRHVIGASSFLWGEHRTLPGIGEDYVYLIWRWNDCCLTF